tara:strand:- start:6087 stop:6392 length:306 start_codon:yes stop_codon:yes gene_type:complete
MLCCKTGIKDGGSGWTKPAKTVEAAHNLKHYGDSLDYSQPYFYMPSPPCNYVSGKGGMTVGKAGKLYVATTLGLQLFVHDGRCYFILSKSQNKKLSNAIFG